MGDSKVSRGDMYDLARNFAGYLAETEVSLNRLFITVDAIIRVQGIKDAVQSEIVKINNEIHEKIKKAKEAQTKENGAAPQSDAG